MQMKSLVYSCLKKRKKKKRKHLFTSQILNLLFKIKTAVKIRLVGRAGGRLASESKREK